MCCIFAAWVGRFCPRVSSADIVCLFLFLLRFFRLCNANRHNLGVWSFGWVFFRLLAFFWLVCWCLFLVCCFLAVVRLDKYRRPDPCDHYHAFFTCSPIVYISTTPIPTIHGHRCTSGLVCVSVASVHVCLWPCAHIVRSCAYVFADVFGAYVCELGVFPVSIHP